MWKASSDIVSTEELLSLLELPEPELDELEPELLLVELRVELLGLVPEAVEAGLLGETVVFRAVLLPSLHRKVMKLRSEEIGWRFKVTIRLHLICNCLNDLINKSIMSDKRFTQVMVNQIFKVRNHQKVKIIL